MSPGAPFGSLKHPVASVWAAMTVFGRHLRILDQRFGNLWLWSFVSMRLLGGSLKLKKVSDPSESDGSNTHHFFGPSGRALGPGCVAGLGHVARVGRALGPGCVESAEILEKLIRQAHRNRYL